MAKRKSSKPSTPAPSAVEADETPSTAPDLAPPVGSGDEPDSDSGLGPQASPVVAASAAATAMLEHSSPAVPSAAVADHSAPRSRAEGGWRLIAAPAFLAAIVTLAAAGGAALSPFAAQAFAPTVGPTEAVGARLGDALSQLAADVSALRAAMDAGAAVQQASLAGITQRLDRLEGWESAVAARLAKLPETRETQAVSREITGAIAVPKEPTVEGWVVRSAGNGRAIIEGRGSLFQVAPGSQIPGVGSVKEIVLQAGRWLVVTSGGVIGQPPPARG